MGRSYKIRHEDITSSFSSAGGHAICDLGSQSHGIDWILSCYWIIVSLVPQNTFSIYIWFVRLQLFLLDADLITMIHAFFTQRLV